MEDEIRKPNNEPVVCMEHEMQIILGKSYCTDLLARKNSIHLSHTLTTSQKTFTTQRLNFTMKRDFKVAKQDCFHVIMAYSNYLASGAKFMLTTGLRTPF